MRVSADSARPYGGREWTVPTMRLHDHFTAAAGRRADSVFSAYVIAPGGSESGAIHHAASGCASCGRSSNLRSSASSALSSACSSALCPACQRWPMGLAASAAEYAPCTSAPACRTGSSARSAADAPWLNHGRSLASAGCHSSGAGLAAKNRASPGSPASASSSANHTRHPAA